MMVNRRFLNWGVFLVAAGAVMLVAQTDAVNSDVVAQALRLWPVVVIALGIGVLLRRTRFGLAGGVLAAAMPGFLLGGLVVAAPHMVSECGDVQPAASPRGRARSRAPRPSTSRSLAAICQSRPPREAAGNSSRATPRARLPRSAFRPIGFR